MPRRFREAPPGKYTQAIIQITTTGRKHTRVKRARLSWSSGGSGGDIHAIRHRTVLTLVRVSNVEHHAERGALRIASISFAIYRAKEL